MATNRAEIGFDRVGGEVGCDWYHGAETAMPPGALDQDEYGCRRRSGGLELMDTERLATLWQWAGRDAKD